VNDVGADARSRITVSKIREGRFSTPSEYIRSLIRDDQDLAGNREVALLIRRWESPAEAERFLDVHSGTSAPIA